MPEAGAPRTVKPMNVQDVVDRVRPWLTLENAKRHRLALEGVVAGLYFLLALFGVAHHGGVFGVAALLILTSTVVLYRIQPFLALSLGAIGTLAMLGTGYAWYTGGFLVFAPLLLVFFGAAAYGRPPTRWLGLVGTLVAALGVFSGLGFYAGVFSGVLIFLFTFSFFGLAWVAGLLVSVNRSRRAAQTGELVATVRLGEAKQEVTLEQERNRVARDVHDIVAHSLAVVIAQADGARYAAKDIPAPVVEALENIASTSRAALTDVRTLLGELRHNQEAGPQPGMDDLDALVRGFRDSGLEVEWSTYGSASELSDTSALAVYRIVQEALTNALRHGDRAQPVELVLDWGHSSVAVVVANGVPRGASVPANPAGHGIPGMRERATLAGGELEAGEGSSGRFRVRATIPFSREAVSA